MKSGYEPGQRAGVNTFSMWGELITIIHPGAVVERLHPGQVLLLRREDNLYWCGRAYNDAFVFLLGCAVPVTVGDAIGYLQSAWSVKEAHQEDDFISQGELDF